MIKKVVLACFILTLCLFCGFGHKEKPYIVLSSGTIDNAHLQRIEKYFLVGQRVNYALITPNGLKYDGIRQQISTQSDKTTNWGFSLISTEDIYIDKSTTVYQNYIVPRNKGHYILQFFYLNKKNYPFAHVEFVVQ